MIMITTTTVRQQLNKQLWLVDVN